QVDLRGLQLVHEHAVGEAVHADGGVDTLDPEGAEIALLDLAADVCMVVPFLNGVEGYGVHVLSAAPVPFGLLEDLLAAGAARYFVLCAWHALFLFSGGSVRTVTALWCCSPWITLPVTRQETVYFRSRRIAFSSWLCTNAVLARLRLRFLCFLVRMWLWNACLRFTLPVPVSLNRFLAPDFVFILGMASLC